MGQRAQKGLHEEKARTFDPGGVKAHAEERFFVGWHCDVWTVRWQVEDVTLSQVFSVLMPFLVNGHSVPPVLMLEMRVYFILCISNDRNKAKPIRGEMFK